MADPQSPMFRFQVWRASLPRALRLLLTINLGVFAVVVVFRILAAFGLTLPYALLEYLVLPGDPARALFRPWTVVTYGFVDLLLGPAFWGLIAFAFAMYWLTWLGRDYEETYGAHRLFGLYVGSTVFGAAVALALASFGDTPLTHLFYDGAWGPVTAVLVCVATLQPNRGVGLFLLGVVPMKWIAVGFVVLTLLQPSAAVLGAALFGVLFAKAQQSGVDLAAWARPFFGAVPESAMGAAMRSWFTREEEPVRAAPAARRRRSRPQPTTPVPDEVSPVRSRQAEVDRILDKILEQGFEALTDEEKRILDDASRRS